MIRPLDVPADYPELARLLSGTGPVPVTPEELDAQDRALPPADALTPGPDGLLTGHGRIRLVEEHPDRRLLAFATTWWASWAPPGDIASHLAPGNSSSPWSASWRGGPGCRVRTGCPVKSPTTGGRWYGRWRRRATGSRPR
ncbi:hypothetical protein [Kitasatospora sp. P5_F3]